MHLQTLCPTRSRSSTSPTKQRLHRWNVVARFLLLLITALTITTTTTTLARAYQHQYSTTTATSSFLFSRQPTTLRSSSRPPTRLWLAANAMSKSKSNSKDKAAVDTTASMSTSTDLLESWASHTHVSFHDFSSTEAAEIREALLTWYVEHRRKLPWRGDPPPWQGSTAKKVVKKKKQQAKDNKEKGKQKGIQEFFAVKKETPSSELSLTDTEATTSATTTDNQDDVETAFTVTAYGVWVSEIMLQQTRVEAVIPYWIKWMKVFPTVQDLAAADPETVNAMWAGLGFYRRARLLQSAAKVVTKELSGVLPDTVDGLLTLPGIGPYTASAIASIACNITVPVVDGNVCRVLSRLKGISNHIKAPKLKDVWGWELARQIVEAGDGTCAGQVNQALMELGATYCAPSGTGIEEGDPLKDYYWSTRLGRELAEASADADTDTLDRLMTCAEDAVVSIESSCAVCAPTGVVDALGLLSSAIADELEESTPGESIDNAASKCGHAVFPLAPPKMEKREEVLAVAVMSQELVATTETAWLLVRRPKTGLLAGQWEFPSACVWTSESDKNGSKGKGKRKDMSKEVPIISTSVRRKALNSLLKEVTTDADGELLHDLSSSKRSNMGGESLEHVFSHVRHTMWIEHASLSVYDMGQDEWVDSKDREVRWMFESDMEKVGVTSGVKKVLKAVKKAYETSTTANKRQRLK
jgi:A/G-specific adenine glycosylase